MHKSVRSGQIRLEFQLGILLIVLVTITAAAIGLPTIWLLQRELREIARRQVEQGGRTVEASLAARVSELENLALLTAQRPTLLALLGNADNPGLQNYLETLKIGAGLDILAVCTGPDLIAGAGEVDWDQFCGASIGKRLYLQAGGSTTVGWLVDEQPLSQAPGNTRVVVGYLLDPDFIVQVGMQSGFEVILLTEGKYVAGSLAADDPVIGAISSRLATLQDGEVSEEIVASNGAYLAHRRPFTEAGIDIVVALSTDGIVFAQRRLAQTIGLGMLVVIAAASGLASFLARRISQPLERLRAAAVKLRKGDLTTPVGTRTKVREITQVAFALEDARSALQHTLGALRREKEWSDHLLDSVVEGIVTLDRTGRITFFSKGAERISGWRSELALGKPIDDVLQLADTDETFSHSLPEPGERPAVRSVRTRGRRVTLAITGARLAPPGAGRVDTALVLRDVTDEEAIRRLLGDFLANITHEFRTPLSALAASIELMLDQLPDLDLAELRELLDSLRLGTLSLQTLIDNLLEGASIEAGRFRVQPRPADLSAVVTEVAATMQPLFEKYRQQLQLDLPVTLPMVQIDPRRTAQVLVNLLSNAIKWNPDGSVISLRAAEDNGMVRLSVMDCGPGIPLPDLPDVFTRFSQLRAADGRAGYGAGLGLSVVKAIIEAQGGQVGVENCAGGGADFWFSLPAVK